MSFRFASWFQLRSVQIGFVAILVSGLSAQVTDLHPRVGVPEDWSHHRIKFNSAYLRQHPEIAAREPRAAAQLYREAFLQAQAQMGRVLPAQTASADTFTPHRDWSVSLGTGRLGFGQFPAKWNGDPTAAPSCATDYVVYTLNAIGSTGGQPSIVGMYGLYAGSTGTPLCNPSNGYLNNQPYFLFSYNTNTISNGRITTSPVLSIDGKKVAFVETTPNSGTKSSVFHVLKIPGPGSTQQTATPSSAPPAGALASVTIDAASDTRSSPWVDYTTDTAYVALDNGKLYKITGVFNGTPTLVATAPWPVTINLNSTFNSPVLDSTTGNIFLGAGNGRLYTINVNAPAPPTVIQVGRTGANNPGIIDSVMFDVTGTSIFAVTANDNIVPSAAVVQINSTSPFGIVTRVGIGQGSSVGTTAVNLYDGDFDNNYFTSPSTGHMLICGTGAADTIPNRYLLNFDASGVLQPGSGPVPVATNAAARCSPVTEFFNPNIGGGTDFFFWGVTRNCPTNAAGCVMALTNETTLTAAPVTGGTSGIIIDNDYVAQPGGSSIYFSSEAAPNTAYKLTQQGLQ